MTYAQFRSEVIAKGITLAQLRCDEPATDDVLDLIDRCGVDLYESFVYRLQKEVDANLQTMAFGSEWR